MSLGGFLSFDPINIVLLGTSATYFIFGLFLIGKLNKRFIFFILNLGTILVWIAGMILYRSTAGSQLGVYFAGILHASIAFVLYSIYRFIQNYTYSSNINITRLISLVTFVVLPVSFLMIDDVLPTEKEPVILFNNLVWIYMSLTSLVSIICFKQLYDYYRTLTDFIEKKSTRIILYGYFVSISIAFLTNLLLPMSGNFNLNWFGQVVSIFMIVSVAYGIFKFTLFNVKFFTSKTVKYFIFASFTYVIFYSLVYLYIELFGSAFSKGSYVFGIFLAPLFVYLLFKLENIANFVNLKLFGNLFIHNDVFNSLTKFMSENLDKGELIQNTEVVLSSFLEAKVKVLKSKSSPDFLKVLEIPVNHHYVITTSEKYNNSLYNKEDVKLLRDTAFQLAFALERSELYARVANYATDLEKEVEVKTAELKTANDSLLDLLKNKEEVLRIINHQLNTPISIIKSTAGMVRDGIWSMQKFYEITLKEVASMETILKDFWEAQDARDIKSKLKLQKASFSDLVKSILEEKKLNEKVSSGQVKLVPGIEFSQKSFTLPMDKSEIEQVVSNYIENALFYTKQGEIHIICDDSQLGKIIFSVQDTGMGSSSEMLPKLFGKFVRSKNAELARPSGSGLGLYICKKIIEAHGGRVWAESPGEGLGATFYFELPNNA